MSSTVCVWCKIRPIDSKIGEVCSERCFDARQKLKRSQKMDKHGYIRNKNGSLIHRLTYERTRGKIPKNWIVHHLDGNKRNNFADNLIALPQWVHTKAHGMKELPDRNLLEIMIMNWQIMKQDLERNIRKLKEDLKMAEENLKRIENRSLKNLSKNKR